MIKNSVTAKRSVGIAAAALTAVVFGLNVYAQEHSYICGCHACASTSGGGEAQGDFELFQVSDRWFRTATEGFNSTRGNPRTLTYGVVPDGTTINGTSRSTEDASDPSDLVAFLNSTVGDESVWSALIDDAYQRWGELSGLTMIRETNDDGVAMGQSGSRGQLGVRADMRIGGRFIDGDGSGVLAYNYTPDNGDQVIDTSNTSFYGRTSNNYRALRNVLMHEAGHGLGFSHFESNNSNGLMEPLINTSFDGPQHDDILAVQRNYGDALEKNGGNDSVANATGLGVFSGADTLSIGTDADDNTAFVAASETDFVSIDGTSDTDVFSFSLLGTDVFEFTLLLDPKGPTYNEGPQDGAQSVFNTKALTDLELELLDSSGSILASANLTAAGDSETINTVLTPGDYFARVSTASGATDNVQLYRLDVTADTLLPGDANFDGVVDSDDFNILAFNFGATDASWTEGDFDGDGVVGSDDFNLLAFNFGQTTGTITVELAAFEAFATALAAPEPGSFALLAVGGAILVRRRRR
jgi:hypothetical protein